jgi:hypothetical protein
MLKKSSSVSTKTELLQVAGAVAVLAGVFLFRCTVVWFGLWIFLASAAPEVSVTWLGAVGLTLVGSMLLPSRSGSE